MKRRDFIAGIGAAVWPLAARAQAQRRVGVLMNSAPQLGEQASYLGTFVEGMRKLGWTDGENFRLETRWSAGDVNLIQRYATELVQWNPDVLVVASSANLAAVRRATSTIPIVFTIVSDPVAQGFVSNLQHPGGNITGFGEDEAPVAAKWLDLLRQMAPRLTRCALVFNPETGPQYTIFLSAIKVASAWLGVEEVAAIPIHNLAEIEPAIASFSREPNGGLIVSTDSFLRRNVKLIVESAARNRVPAIYPTYEYVTAGGLMYYFADLTEQFRQAPFYVDRILKGAKPGDLPVQLPTKFRFAINRKTADSLGVEIPLGLLLFADEVIE
jgi:putative tryptophan/tyrosine transport system substrate-binding protein